MKLLMASILLCSSLYVRAEQSLLCSEHHEGSIICDGNIYFQSNLVGEKQASCYDNPELSRQIQSVINSVQRDEYKDASGDFTCDRYHENTVICADGLVYLSELSDDDLMTCMQTMNSSRAIQEAVNQVLMEAAIDRAIQEAVQGSANK